jgi:hypothetical protein
MSPVALEYNRGYEPVIIHILYLMDSIVRERTCENTSMKAKFVLQTILILTVYAGLFDVVDVEGE